MTIRAGIIAGATAAIVTLITVCASDSPPRGLDSAVAADVSDGRGAGDVPTRALAISNECDWHAFDWWSGTPIERATKETRGGREWIVAEDYFDAAYSPNTITYFLRKMVTVQLTFTDRCPGAGTITIETPSLEAKGTQELIEPSREIEVKEGQQGIGVMRVVAGTVFCISGKGDSFFVAESRGCAYTDAEHRITAVPLRRIQAKVVADFPIVTPLHITCLASGHSAASYGVRFEYVDGAYRSQAYTILCTGGVQRVAVCAERRSAVLVSALVPDPADGVIELRLGVRERDLLGEPLARVRADLRSLPAAAFPGRLLVRGRFGGYEKRVEAPSVVEFSPLGLVSTGWFIGPAALFCGQLLGDVLVFSLDEDRGQIVNCTSCAAYLMGGGANLEVPMALFGFDGSIEETISVPTGRYVVHDTNALLDARVDITRGSVIRVESSAVATAEVVSIWIPERAGPYEFIAAGDGGEGSMQRERRLEHLLIRGEANIDLPRVSGETVVVRRLTSDGMFEDIVDPSAKSVRLNWASKVELPELRLIGPPESLVMTLVGSSAKGLHRGGRFTAELRSGEAQKVLLPAGTYRVEACGQCRYLELSYGRCTDVICNEKEQGAILVISDAESSALRIWAKLGSDIRELAGQEISPTEWQATLPPNAQSALIRARQGPGVFLVEMSIPLGARRVVGSLSDWRRKYRRKESVVDVLARGRAAWAVKCGMLQDWKLDPPAYLGRVSEEGALEFVSNLTVDGYVSVNGVALRFSY